MKTSFFTFIFFNILVSLLVTACSNETEQPDRENGVAARISAETGGSPKTRATDNAWNENDLIGITMIDPQTMNVINPYRNFGYITPGDGKFTPRKAGQIIYFPSNYNEVTFRAYYPYSNNLSPNLLIPVSVKDQTVLAGIDLMTAEHLSGTSANDPNVKLRFHHRLAKVAVHLYADNDGIDVLHNVKLVMKGLKTEGSYNLLSEELFINNTPVEDVTIPVFNAMGKAIVLPRPAGGETEFEITTADGGIYRAAMSSNLELKAGYVHTFHIRLKTPAEISATIEPWTEGPEFRFDVIRIVTGVGVTQGFKAGQKLDLFLKEGTGQEFGFLGNFTYEGNNRWTPDTPLHWENIAGNPALFRGAAILDKALNSTQMDDILISKDTEAAPYTGVNLTLEHVGSKATVLLQSPDGSFSDADLKNASVIFPDYLYTGSYNDKGEFAPGAGRTDITPENGVAIFPPQTVGKGENVLVVTINGHQYTVKPEDLSNGVADAVEYEAGTTTNLIVSVKKSGLGVSAETAPWTELPAMEFNALFFTAINPASGGFEHNDSVRFYKLTDGGNSVDGNTRIYNYEGGPDYGTFSPAGTPWYRDDFKTGDLFAGVYPASASNLGNGERTFEWNCVQNGTTNARSDDVMVAAPAANRNLGVIGQGGNVNFEFRHVLSKVSVNLIAGEGFTPAEVSRSVIEMNNFRLSGQVDVIEGTATPSGAVTAAFNPVKTAQVHTVEGKIVAASYEAFVMPQTIAADEVMVTVRLNGALFEVKMATDKLFAAGAHNMLNLTLHKTGVVLSASVVDWNKEPDTDIELH